MQDTPKFLLVDTGALPRCFLKVVEAKEMLAQGLAKNSSEAVKKVGISRSAFYKYKDRVYRPAGDSRQLCTFSFSLRDEPGSSPGSSTPSQTAAPTSSPLTNPSPLTGSPR